MANSNSAIAHEIIEIFENLLESKGIEIPCESEREEKDRHFWNNVPIYGTEYGELSDKIASLLDEYI